ncbi:capsular polysaccharide biosynthesis protein [Amphritea sp. 2_MG-2023]|uniref:capsular polysaccharide biosynthesis protein n=1 Tax=Amphritea TaxID=515417 RepID=UPI001C06CC95|nr:MULTISPECIES: capsular polysaccharide biosynthesis protein [Amphritea]MBU2964997.1 capsular polysaccharide biosynthesis protein [Amphritea atlantica]MDO6418782.1 capsular polysaccharide biosynthesis protein [Amphritea sp. 2_MG-2023]
MIGYVSKGIAKIPFLESFTGMPCSLLTHNVTQDVSYIAGWGLKSSAKKARNLALKFHLPYLSLEDGFIRSLGLGVDGSLQHSMIIDKSGIYYDATRKSDLEDLIYGLDKLSAVNDIRAHRCISDLKRYQLSKYNQSSDKFLCSLSSGKPVVLVVDQTFGDASIEYGMGSEDSFKEMLETAIEENPDAEILVKIHPDVLAGKKKGYLLEVAKKYNCQILAEDINPWSVLDVVEHVYVVTSQLGFEALMAGKKVTCFGMPFYAGWGLTDDRQTCNRRGVSRSLEQVFYAAYIQYCRYINPYTGVPCQLEDTIKLIAHQKQHLERYRGSWFASDFSNWKIKFIPHYLGLGAAVTFTENLEKDINKLQSGDNLLIWSSRISDRAELLCKRNNLKLWRMEDGFIRSVGLGTDLVPPLSLVIDSCGIYYDSTKPSDLENIYNTYTFDESLLLRAEEICNRLVELKLSKYNVGVSTPLVLPSDRTIILVPGQVETDASIAKGSPVIKTNHALLDVVRKENPDAFIIYKPHPDVLSGGRFGDLQTTAETLYDLMVTDISITDLFDVVDEIHTMSSLSGFEGLLRQKKVRTYGMPFYAGWGLTNDYLSCERRNKKLTLNELVAGALILYPIYVDSESGDVIDIETAIELLSKKLGSPQRPSIKTRIYRVIRNRFLKR